MTADKNLINKHSTACRCHYKYAFYAIGAIILLGGLVIDIGIPLGMNNSFSYPHDLNPINSKNFNNATWMTIGYTLSFVGLVTLLITVVMNFKKDASVNVDMAAQHERLPFQST